MRNASRGFAALGLLASLAAACASPPDEAERLEASPASAAAPREAERAPSDRPDALRLAEEAGAPPIFAPPRGPSTSAAELAIWNDPGFRARFLESYVAETEIEPRVTIVERDQMQQVLDFLATDRADRAVQSLEKWRGEGSSAVFDLTLANVHFQQERLEEAASAFQVAVDKYPKFRRAWRNLGMLRVRQGEFAEAIPALTRVLALGGGDGITYGLLGFAYSNTGDHLAAETSYRMAALLEPETLDWRMGLARSLFKQDRFADAAAVCSLLIAGDPERAELWLLQANAYIGLQQPRRAAENLEWVDRLGKSTPESLDNLGDIYVNEELFDLAVGAYLRAMGMGSERRPERALRAAKVLIGRGALPETRALLEGIESTFGDRLEEGDRKDFLRMRARLAVAEGAGEEEAAVLEEIVALDPLDGEALLLLGQHHGRAGDVERAIFYYERAAGLEVFEADAKVRHAQVLVGQGRYAEAVPLLRRAQLLKPRDNVQEYLNQVERVSQGR